MNEGLYVCMSKVCIYDEGRLRIRYSTKQGTGKTHKTYGIQIRVSLRSRTYILVFRYSSRSRRISATIPFHQPGGRNTEVCSLFPLLWHLKRLLLKASWAQIESLRREPFAYWLNSGKSVPAQRNASSPTAATNQRFPGRCRRNRRNPSPSAQPWSRNTSLLKKWKNIIRKSAGRTLEISVWAASSRGHREIPEFRRNGLTRKNWWRR